MEELKGFEDIADLYGLVKRMSQIRDIRVANKAVCVGFWGFGATGGVVIHCMVVPVLQKNGGRLRYVWVWHGVDAP